MLVTEIPKKEIEIKETENKVAACNEATAGLIAEIKSLNEIKEQLSKSPPLESKAKAIKAVTGLGAKKAVMQKTYEASKSFLTKAMRRYRHLMQVLQH